MKKFVLSLLVVFSLLVTAQYQYTSKVALDNEGYVNIDTGKSFYLGECREDFGDEYAFALYGKVFEGVDIDPEELLSKCTEPNGVDQIVQIIDEKTRGKDISNVCTELDDAIARCESAQDHCAEIKEKRGELQFSCPPDEDKLVELCKTRFQTPVDHCEEEYARSKDKLARYCSGDYVPPEFTKPVEKRYDYPVESEEQARRKCTNYGGNWQSGQCEFSSDKPISEEGKCPSQQYTPDCRTGRIVERTYDHNGLQCTYKSCEFDGTATSTCPSVPVPSCSAGQYTRGTSYDANGCPTAYECSDSSTQPTSTSTCNAPIPTCPAGQYAQAQSGQNTPCPYNYQCVSSTQTSGANTSTTSSSGSCTSQPTCSSDRVATVVNRVSGCPVYSCEPAVCPPPQTCNDGTTAVQGGGVQYVGSQACYIYTCTGTSGSTTTGTSTATGTSTSGGAGACNEPTPTCPVGQYAQAQSGQGTSCPSNYQCVNSPSSSTGGSGSSTSGTTSGASCPGPQTCSSGTATATGNFDSAGCAVYACPPVTTTARSITGLQVAAGTSAPSNSEICPARPYDPAIEEQVAQRCREQGGTPYTDRCGFTACNYDQNTDTGFCTKEGFLRNCRAAIFSYDLNANADEICSREVKYNLPSFEKFCAEGGETDLYGRCKAHAAQACGCMKKKAANCKSFANRDKFLELVKQRAELECKKRSQLTAGVEGSELYEKVDSFKEALPVEDKVVVEKASKDLVLTQEEYNELVQRIREEEQRDAFLRVKKLLGLYSGQVDQQIASLREQIPPLEAARDSMKEVCERLSDEEKVQCDEAVAGIDSRIVELQNKITALETERGGILGALAKLLGG